MVRFSPSGVAAYGYSQVNVDGAVPAPLVGRTVGQPAWQSDTELVYQDGDAGAGPWIVNQLTYPGLTVATVSATGANVTGGGGGVWAKWLGGTGVDASIGGWTILPNAFLADVSPNGEVVVVDDYQTGSGLTVYDNSGAVSFTLPSVVVANNRAIRLRDNILSYVDKNGWHLVDITTGLTPSWYPRIDGVNDLVPITFSGVLYVLERTEQLTVRAANRSVGWVLRATPDTFSPDGIAVGSVIRCGSCTQIGEETDTLVTFDVTVGNSSTIDVIVGTISGGAIVYQPSTTVSSTPFAVGSLEGQPLSSSVLNPQRHPVVDRQNRDLITRPWQQWAQKVDEVLQRVSGVVQDTPTVAPASNGFTGVTAAGEPTAVATPVNSTLTLASNPASLWVINPSTNTATLDLTTGSVGSYVPVSTGAEPLVILSNGAGEVLLTLYTP